MLKVLRHFKIYAHKGNSALANVHTGSIWLQRISWLCCWFQIMTHIFKVEKNHCCELFIFFIPRAKPQTDEERDPKLPCYLKIWEMIGLGSWTLLWFNQTIIICSFLSFVYTTCPGSSSNGESQIPDVNNREWRPDQKKPYL